MKKIIVFYSLEGNTAWAVKRLAACLGAELLELKAEKAFPDKGFKKFFWGGKSAVMGEEPALADYYFDPASWEEIIFAFPVWAGTFAPPIRSFISREKAALPGKQFAALACQSGSGAQKAFEKLEKALGAPLKATLVLIDPKDRPQAENEQRIRDFAGSL